MLKRLLERFQFNEFLLGFVVAGIMGFIVFAIILSVVRDFTKDGLEEDLCIQWCRNRLSDMNSPKEVGECLGSCEVWEKKRLSAKGIDREQGVWYGENMILVDK